MGRPNHRAEMNYLIPAVLKNDIRAISELLTSHKPDDERDRDGCTALMNAMIHGRIDIMKLLLNAGADPDIQDRSGWTALHFASQEQSTEAIELLVSRRATLDIPDMHGNTPLGNAVFNYRGTGDAVSTLLRLGADRNFRNHSGISPLSLANRISNYDVRKFFSDD